MPPTRLLIAFLVVALLTSTPGRAEPPSPWGVSSSASAFRDRDQWFPKMAGAGVTSVRLFPEWRNFEREKGKWTWDDGDALMKSAADHKLEITGVLMGSPPGDKAAHAFPMDRLDDWSGYVGAAVGRYGKRIRHWEVWNEGNGGFNDGKHTTADYAKLAVATYDAAKKADPDVKIGLSVASFDAPYLNEAIRAMAKAGKPGRFDHLCIHPYEIADGLGDPDGEVPYLWMTRLMRDMLRKNAPDRADADIWITEVSRRIESKRKPAVTEDDAARSLVKLYTMAIAQGIARVQWFEARDPAGEDQGFGLLTRDGSPRPSYHTFGRLTAALDSRPVYLGWLAVGKGGRGYGFAFEGKDGPVLVAWMPAGLTDRTATFDADVKVTDLLTGKAAPLKAGDALALTDAPVLVGGLPAGLVATAKANAGKPFPWGGDYSAAKTVSLQLGATDGERGVSPLGRQPTVSFPDGSSGVVVRGDIGHPLSLRVHPSFASFHTREYHVRVTARRVGDGNVGMNLLYETADSQGRAAYVNAGKWFGVSKDDGWQTYTWHLTDACLSKMWGYDLVVRPEQSVPFVVGKIEVSTEPFK